ncbi:MAG: transposase [Planctomycetota bacterium]
MKELKDRGIEFVMRASTKLPHKAVGEFIMNQGRDRVIEVAGTRGSSRRDKPVSVRAVFRERRNDDECLVYLTSLHRNEATALEVHELYALRWTVEEHFKVEKGDYLGQRQLHAKSPDGIRQEIIAFALLTAVTRSVMADAAAAHEVKPSDVSQKAGYLVVGSYLTRMLADPVTEAERKTVERMLRRITAKLEPPRPGRSYPRRSFKPLPKWGGAHGRRWREKRKR